MSFGHLNFWDEFGTTRLALTVGLSLAAMSCLCCAPAVQPAAGPSPGPGGDGQRAHIVSKESKMSDMKGPGAGGHVAVGEAEARIADEYIANYQGWPRDAYYLEASGITDPQAHPSVLVVYKADLHRPRVGGQLPRGGGRSMRLVVDLKKKAVVAVYRSQ